jgi:thiosulfate/3-mercaptopyruvate sulfurtransferase
MSVLRKNFGELLHMPVTHRKAMRGGHIPGAVNIPWSQPYDGGQHIQVCWRPTKIYQDKDLTPEKQIIAYCRIGERSSHMVRTKVLPVIQM